MAVTIALLDLPDAIRIGSSTEEVAAATRLLATASAMVLKWAPDAPDAIHNEAVVRLSAWMFDVGGGSGLEQMGAKYSRPMTSSGAAHLLAPWRAHTAAIAKVSD